MVYIHRYTYYIYEIYMYIYLYWASKTFSFFDRVGINKNDCNRLKKSFQITLVPENPPKQQKR